MAAPNPRRWMLTLAIVLFALDMVLLIAASTLGNVHVQIPIPVTLGVSVLLIGGGLALMRIRRSLVERDAAALAAAAAAKKRRRSQTN